MAIKINKQFKMQIHYNYLYILSKLGEQPPQNIKSIIINNLLESEKIMDKNEIASIKGNYFIYMLRNHFHLSLGKNFNQTLPHNIKMLQTKDGGFTFLPNKNSIGDVYSTRMALEIMDDYDKNLFRNEINRVKKFVLANIKNQKQATSLIEAAEFINLAKMAGVNVNPD
nr:hypothetical protein [Aneurinibacillus terranovensis]